MGVAEPPRCCCYLIIAEARCEALAGAIVHATRKIRARPQPGHVAAVAFGESHRKATLKTA